MMAKQKHDCTDATLANFGLSPTASCVTALAWQAPRRSGRGLAVR